MSQSVLILLSSSLFGTAVFIGVGPLFRALNQMNKTFFEVLELRMRQLGMSVAHLPAASSGRWLASGVVAIVVAFGFGMPPVGAFLGLLTFNLIGLLLLYLVEAHRTRIRDQLVIMTRNFSNQVRAGLSLPQALRATASTLPPPFGPLLQRADYQVNETGLTLREAFTELKNEVQIDGLTIFVIAVLIANEKGGELPDKLDRIAFSLEEIQRVERKKESDTASGRLVVTLLACFPFAFLGLFYFMDPDGTGLVFALTSGQIVLSGVGLIVYVSVRWAQSILNRVE